MTSTTNSPVRFAGGSSFLNATFDPLTTGRPSRRVHAPAGFAVPTNRPQAITATLT